MQGRDPRVEDLRPEEAASVLRRLLDEGGVVADAVRLEMVRVLTHVEPDDVAAEVQTDLELLEVEELWDRSGKTRHGYTHPADMAWQMIEEVLTPYLKRMKQYQEVGLAEERDRYVLGVLQGIYAFEHETQTDFQEWAPDDTGEAFRWILDEWKKTRKGKRARQQMHEALAERCPEWASRLW